MKPLAATLIVVVLALGWAWAAEDLALVKDGQPTCSIVIAKEATKAAQLGAFELQHHIGLITGATVPIVTEDQPVEGTRLLVGDSAPAQALGVSSQGFQSQEYTVKFFPNAVVMLGSDKDDRGEVKYDENDPFRFGTWPSVFDACGSMYAVYDVLEEYCGVRWFNPTELGIVYPHRRTLVLSGGRDEKRAPAFWNRDAGPAMAEGWEAYCGLWRTDQPQFKELEQMGWEELHKRWPGGWQFIHAKRSACTLHKFRARLGGEAFAANHSFYGYLPRFWKQSSDATRAKDWEGAHPEYFAQGYENEPPQMCYSSEALVEQAAKDAHEYFTTGKSYYGSVNSGGKYFAAMPMDNGSWCKCDKCQAALRPDMRFPGFNGYASDYVFGFVNKVARKVAQTDPGKYIAVCAYADYTWRPSFALEPNVAVDMCLHTRNWFAPFAEKHDREIVAQWAGEVGKRPLHCWVYWTFPKEIADHGKFHAFPGAFAHTAAQQFRWLNDSGVRGIFFCGYGQDVEAYVASKMMDDPSRDVDTLLDEFFTMQYGAAGQPLRQFYEAVEETYMNPQNYPPDIASGKRSTHQTRSLAWEWLGTPERMARFAQLIAEADAARVTSLQRRRVELFKKQIWEYMLAGRKLYEEQMAIPVAKVTVPRVAAVNGDPLKADWSQAAALDNWRLMTGAPATYKLSGQIAHDGQYLYVKLIHDDMPTKDLRVGSSPWADCWELFTGWKPEVPYRQMGIGPTGQHAGITYGESTVAGETSGEWDSGARIVSDTSAEKTWVTHVAFPLNRLLMNGGPKAGDTFSMNFERTRWVGGWIIHGWSPSFAGTHEPTRMGELTLAP